jgi:hypothetical protein
VNVSRLSPDSSSWQLHLLRRQWLYQVRRLTHTDTLPMRRLKHEQMARYLTARLAHDIIRDFYWAPSGFTASRRYHPISHQRVVQSIPKNKGTEHATYEK